MPHSGIAWKKENELLTYEEIVRVARIFAALGVNKIRLTGGEPLVRKNLEELIEQLASLDGIKTLAMTTNATLLAPKAKLLRNLGLTALNISLDTFRKERFEKITRRDDFERVIAGLESALSAGFSSIKINMVAIAGFNDDEVMDFAEYAFSHPVNVRFIEYMPFKDNDWQVDKVITFAEMKQLIEQRYRLKPLEVERSAVGKDFAIEGGAGSVSFISSMSDSFCGTCNRLRLTADGSIKSCLFYPAETNVREALRQGASDRDIENLILYALALKPEAHPPAAEIAAADNRAMIEIGG
jgi:cyclic pyranopterin phosphate synthase